jgi:hypothetical protein
MPDSVVRPYLGIGDNGQNIKRFPAIAGGGSAAGEIVALGSDGKLANSMLPSGLGVAIQRHKASENVVGLVNIWYDSTANENEGGWFVRKADASDATKFASGYVKESVTSGEDVDVYLEGTYTLTSNLPEVYLSKTPGGAGAYDSTAAIRQLVGRRVSLNTYAFIHGDITILNPTD